MEAKCEYYVDSCRDLMESYAIVVRDGLQRRVSKEQLVVGDLLVLEHGDQLKADVKLVEATDLTINIELLEQKERFYYKQLYGTVERNFEVEDILLHGSYVGTGSAKAIILATRNSYITKSLIVFDHKPRKADREDLQPLTFELNSFLNYLTLIAITFAFAWSREYSLETCWNDYKFFVDSGLPDQRLSMVGGGNALHRLVRGHHHRSIVAHTQSMQNPDSQGSGEQELLHPEHWCARNTRQDRCDMHQQDGHTHTELHACLATLDRPPMHQCL